MQDTLRPEAADILTFCHFAFFGLCESDTFRPMSCKDYSFNGGNVSGFSCRMKMEFDGAVSRVNRKNWGVPDPKPFMKTSSRESRRRVSLCCKMVPQRTADSHVRCLVWVCRRTFYVCHGLVPASRGRATWSVLFVVSHPSHEILFIAAQISYVNICVMGSSTVENCRAWPFRGLLHSMPNLTVRPPNDFVLKSSFLFAAIHAIQSTPSLWTSGFSAAENECWAMLWCSVEIENCVDLFCARVETKAVPSSGAFMGFWSVVVSEPAS